VEVLNMIFENLDLQSLSRVLQTCLKGKIIVEKLPAYRDLMTYASDIFTALSQMGIIHVHSASTIHAALRTDRCVVCGEYGENLFLPTCDRACQACHCSNYAFWTIPVDGPTGASMVFNLGPDHFKSVLNFCSFGEPDEYGQRRSMRRNTGSRPQRPKSITSKVAMDLGIEANGSEEGLASHMQSYFPALKSRASRGFRNHVLQHPADELASHILSWNQRAHYDNVFRYSGPCASNFAVIYFPSLVNNTLDLGRLCYGCNKALVNNWKSHGRRAWVRDLLKQHRVRSKAEFLEHVKNCSRAKALVVELLRRRKENDAASIADENWFKRSHHSEVFSNCTILLRFCLGLVRDLKPPFLRSSQSTSDRSINGG
jgi:hypothetical protein